MEIKYTEKPKIKKAPCLMKNPWGEVVFVPPPGQQEGDHYVTVLTGDKVETWQSDLKDYEPFPEGTKIEIVN